MARAKSNNFYATAGIVHAYVCWYNRDCEKEKATRHGRPHCWTKLILQYKSKMNVYISHKKRYRKKE